MENLGFDFNTEGNHLGKITWKYIVLKSCEELIDEATDNFSSQPLTLNVATRWNCWFSQKKYTKIKKQGGYKWLNENVIKNIRQEKFKGYPLPLKRCKLPCLIGLMVLVKQHF